MTEHEEQVSLIKWAKEQQETIPELKWLHSIPNGTKTTYYKSRTGATYSPQKMYMIAEGLKSGVCDLCLPCARGGYNGLYIEMKDGKKKPSPSQVEFIEFVLGENYLAVVCSGYGHAKAELMAYINLDGANYEEFRAEGSFTRTEDD